MRSLRFAVRMLLRNPGYAVIAVMTLALGIGANTAIFSIVDTVLLKPLPYPRPDRIVGVFTTFLANGVERDIFSAPNYLDLAQASRSFEAIAITHGWGYDITGEGEPERVSAALVSSSFFSVLGVSPVMGRALLPEEEVRGKDDAVVIGHRLWQNRFGSDPQIVGRSITLSGRPYVVAGVMPPGFQYPDRTQIWAPLALDAETRRYRGRIEFDVVARLAHGVALVQAQSEMRTLGETLGRDHPADNAGMGIILVPLTEKIVGPVRPALLMLLGAVALVLLIACANMANLLLAGATIRYREFAIRAALGASRGRLAGQLLTESLLLALLGGVAGTLLAWWAVDLIVAINPGDVPRLQEATLDLRALAFTLGISLLTGVLFGLAPALASWRSDLQSSLKDGARGSGAATGRARLRSALAAVEVSLVLVLLVGAGLLMKSFSRLNAETPGFQPDRLLSVQIFLPQSRYPDAASRRAFQDALLAKLDTIDGVQRAAIASPAPFTYVPYLTDADFRVVGRPAPPPEQQPIALFNRISAGYFSTMGTPLRRGREFTPRDDAQAPPVAIVNETLARRFWPDSDPIGGKLAIGPTTVLEIVGVAGDTKRGALDAAQRPEIYVPITQKPASRMDLLVRTKGRPADLAPAIKTQIWGVDRDLPATYLTTMDHLIDASLARPRFNAGLLAAFACLALLLAMVGLYGVVAYTVSQRTQEIGVRMALGAQRGDILRLVMSHGMTMIGAGIAIGLAAALALAPAISGLLHGVSAFDLGTYVTVTLATALVAMLACYVPARRATKVDPMIALRYE